MKTGEIKISIGTHFAWWVKPYIYGRALLSRLTGIEPDFDKMTDFCMKGVKVKIGEPQ